VAVYWYYSTSFQVELSSLDSQTTSQLYQLEKHLSERLLTKECITHVILYSAITSLFFSESDSKTYFDAILYY